MINSFERALLITDIMIECEYLLVPLITRWAVTFMTVNLLWILFSAENIAFAKFYVMVCGISFWNFYISLF